MKVVQMLLTVTFVDVRGRAEAPRRDRHPDQSGLGRGLSIAAVLSVVAGILSPIIGVSTWWFLFVPLGLVLSAAAWFSGDRLGLWFVLVVGFVLQAFLVIAAMLTYG